MSLGRQRFVSGSGAIAFRLRESSGLLERLSWVAVDAIARAADAIADALSDGGKVLLFGNGGSAADAQHLAAEFVGRFEREREPLAALSLTTDTSILTALANDYGFDSVFERQIVALGRPRDVVVAISTSGGSRNVLRGVQAASGLGLTMT